MKSQQEDKLIRARELSQELSSIIRHLADEDAYELLTQGVLNELLASILDPSHLNKYPNIAEFLLANKLRSVLIASIRQVITHAYSFKVTTETGEVGYVSPTNVQLVDDGVMFLESDKPFEGFLGLYCNGRASYAVVKRARKNATADDFEFVDIEDFNRRIQRAIEAKASKLEDPIIKFKALLESRNNDESKYQELLQEYPWILGAQYEEIQRHENLDDQNIPDFTGIRVHDGDRDIFELKPPFMKVFLNNGDFSRPFYDAWEQAGRYLNFAREEKDYLRRKGLRFDNPRCYLIVGHNLDEMGMNKLRIKQKLNPSIQILTYDNLLMYMQHTIKLAQHLNK